MDGNGWLVITAVTHLLLQVNEVYEIENHMQA